MALWIIRTHPNDPEMTRPPINRRDGCSPQRPRLLTSLPSVGHPPLGVKPTPKPKARPIFFNVSSVGLAVPASSYAIWRLDSPSALANSSCVIPIPFRISATAPGSRRSPARARSAKVRRFCRTSSLVGFFHRAISCPLSSVARLKDAGCDRDAAPHRMVQNVRRRFHILRHGRSQVQVSGKRAKPGCQCFLLDKSGISLPSKSAIVTA